MRYCIAADAGGSKTDVVLFDETGHILRRHIGPGGNATDIGVDEARGRFETCLEHILPEAPGKIAALYGGMAGVFPHGDFYSSYFRPRLDVGSVRFDDDGCSLLSGTMGHSDGCAMVCGTGSSLFVRIEGQPLRHIGGKGYLIDTGGSGFDLGQRAICMAMRSVDGRCGPTALLQLLEKRIGEPVSDRLIPMIHSRGRPYIASFAGAVFEGRTLGDGICREIFDRGAELMADLTFAAEQYFPGEFSVVIGGGIAANYPEYVDAIAQKASPRCRLIPQEAPPIYGAAVEAAWDAGIGTGDTFRERFLAELSEA